MGVGILASSVHSGILPTDVANLFYWIDAADPLTVDLSGTDVIEWRDKSTNAYEFWADPSSIGPDYTGTINGLPVMTWNNSRLKSRTDLPGHVSRTYCWIMDPTDTDVVITMMSIGGVMVLKIMADGKFHIANGNVVLFPVDCFGLHVWTAVFDGANSKVFKDGLQVWTGDAGSSGAATFRNDIGTDSFGGLPYLGYLPEMAVYSGVLSDINREGLETYLYSKWAGGVPGAPRLDQAVSGPDTPTSVELDWTQGVNSSLVTDYVIERSPNGTSGWTVVTEGTSAATSHIVTGLTTAVIQYFRVKAVNEVGSGAYSNVLSAIPGVIIVLDDFDRADTTSTSAGGAGLGSNWVTGTQGGGADRYHIASNSVVCDINFAAGTLVWGTAMALDDHEVSARIAHTANAGGGAWLIARMPASRATTGYGLVLFGGGWGPSAGDLGVYIFRLTSETETQIAGPYLLGAATGEWDLKLTVVGSTIKAYVDGVERLSVTDTTHSTGTRVAFRIGQNSAGQQLFRWFDAEAITGAATVPGAPTAVTPVAGNAQVALTWTAPASDGGSPVTDYKIEYAVSPPGTSWTPFSDTVSTSTGATVTGLTNGTSYVFRVAAVNSVGDSAWSTASSAATPVAPTAPGAPTLSTATPGNTTVALVWTAPASDGGSAITGYLVEKSPNGSSSWTTEATLGVVLNHTATGLSNGTIQYFRVSAINTVGTGTASNTLSATPATVPGAPTGPTPTPGVGQMSLTWTAPASNGGSALTGYSVQYRTTAGPGAWTPFSHSGTATSTTVTGLTGGTSYDFQVAAINAVGTGSYSTPATATPTGAPTFPVVAATNGEIGTNLGAANAIPSPAGIVAGNLLLAFTANDNPGATDLTGSTGWTRLTHVVQGSNAIKAAVFGRIADGGANDAFALTGAAQDYCCTIVRITGHAVTDLAWAIKIASTTGTTGNPDPPSLDATMSQSWLWLTAAITDLGATGQSLTADPASYTAVENRTSASSTTSVALRTARRDLTTQTENPGTFTGNPTTRPWIGITLAIPSSTVPALVPDAPAAPTGTPGDTQVSLSWTAPAANGASITDYAVQYAVSPPGTSWTTFTDAVSAATAATVTGLTNGQAYVFRVAAINSAGQGAYSSASSPVTSAVGGAVPIFRSATSKADFNGSANFIIDKPAGTVSGDLLVAHVYFQSGFHSSAADFGPPAGWTTITEVLIGNDNVSGLYYKVAGGSEGANYTFTKNDGSNAGGCILCIQVGTFNATPIGTTSGVDFSLAIDTAAGAGVDAPTITPPVANCLGLAFYAAIEASYTWTPPSTWTERVDFTNGYVGPHAATKDLGAGATGTVTATASGSVAANRGVGGLVAVRPT